MNLDVFLEHIPQGVLLTSASLDTTEQFFIRWSARLLSCSETQVLTHPDCFLVRPANKMRQINVEAIRELNRNIWNSPNQATRKVAVIYEADRLPRAAANAFLKTLEEPPTDTSLFLLTTHPYDLLPTLRSRCWWVALPDENIYTVSPDVQTWIEKFKTLIRGLLADEVVGIMQIYGLLYQFQTLFEDETERLQNSTDKEVDISSEELLAVKAGFEKQWIQHFFATMERSLGEVFKSTNTFNKMYLYPQWMEEIEKMFGRTEVNLSPANALEAFLLTMRSSTQV